jgi:hypothetical protein
MHLQTLIQNAFVVERMIYKPQKICNDSGV